MKSFFTVANNTLHSKIKLITKYLLRNKNNLSKFEFKFSSKIYYGNQNNSQCY